MIAIRPTAASRWTAVIVVLCVGLVALERSGFVPALTPLTTHLFEWGILLAAFALLLGAVNVVIVHTRRIQAGQPGWTLSLVLVIALVTVLFAGMVSAGGLASPLMDWLFSAIIGPGYAALFALLAFFMAGAAFALLRFDRKGGGWLLLGVLLMSAAQTPAIRSALPAQFSSAVVWLLDTPVMASLRGVLLGAGVALVTLALRFLFRRG